MRTGKGLFGKMRLKSIGYDQMGRNGYGNKYVGEGFISRKVQGTVKFEGGNIIIWGYMGWRGVGHLAEVKRRIDSN